MATSPAFVGTPNTQNTRLDDVTYALQAVFTAGTSGSIIKSIRISASADQPLSAMFAIYQGEVGYFQCTVPIPVAATADFTNGNVATGQEVLLDTYFPGVGDYIELGPDEVLKVTVHDGTGAAPDAGGYAFIRVVGADY